MRRCTPSVCLLISSMFSCIWYVVLACDDERAMSHVHLVSHVQYLDGIAIIEDVVDHDNPLLIVNGRINLLSQTQLAQTQVAGGVRRAVGGRPTVMIEASQVVSNYTTHGYAAR